MGFACNLLKRRVLSRKCSVHRHLQGTAVIESHSLRQFSDANPQKTERDVWSASFLIFFESGSGSFVISSGRPPGLNRGASPHVSGSIVFVGVQPSSVNDSQASVGMRCAVVSPAAPVAFCAVQETLQRIFASLHVTADCSGGPEDVPGGDRTNKLAMSGGGQSHRSHASASRAVRVTAKLAGLDPRLEIRRERARRLCEDAAAGRNWRR